MLSPSRRRSEIEKANIKIRAGLQQRRSWPRWRRVYTDKRGGAAAGCGDGAGAPAAIQNLLAGRHPGRRSKNLVAEIARGSMNLVSDAGAGDRPLAVWRRPVRKECRRKSKENMSSFGGRPAATGKLTPTSGTATSRWRPQSQPEARSRPPRDRERPASRGKWLDPLDRPWAIPSRNTGARPVLRPRRAFLFSSSACGHLGGAGIADE